MTPRVQKLRRPGLTACLLASLLLAPLSATGADDYPSRPIKLVVGASPGGTTDTMARAIAPPLASSLAGVCDPALKRVCIAWSRYWRANSRQTHRRKQRRLLIVLLKAP